MSGNAVRIMIVDDEKDLVMVTKIFITKCGFEAVSFTDPLEALEYFKKNRLSIALVLTDIRMPGMSGLELAREILKIKPDQKIMLMTAYQVDTIDLQVGLPMITHRDILKKPFVFADICNGIRKTLQVSH